MIQGTPKFDGLAVGELSADFMGGPGATQLRAKIAFVNSKTGMTHGSSTHQGPWSTSTLDKLKELTESMEQDLATHHLTDAVRVTGTSTGRSLVEPEGIGERFGTDPSQV